MNASCGVVRDDNQKPDHDGGLEPPQLAASFFIHHSSVACWHLADVAQPQHYDQPDGAPPPREGYGSRRSTRWGLVAKRIVTSSLSSVGNEYGTTRDQDHAEPIWQRKPLAQKEHCKNCHEDDAEFVQRSNAPGISQL